MKPFAGRCCEVTKIIGKTHQTFLQALQQVKTQKRWKSDKENLA